MKNLNLLIQHSALLSMVLGFANTTTQAQAPSAQKEYGETAGTQFYNYAPSYIQTSSTERYMCVCRNKVSGEVKDHIMMRKSTLTGGTWTWGAPQELLAPSANPNDWDSRHVCDPELRKGSFTYNGTSYSWVMFYLGVKSYTELQNQIGVAFANSPEGPWIKYAGNPLIASTTTTQWGVGQPAATSVDGQGRFLLYYTRSEGGGNRLIRRDINLNNMSSPVIGPAVEVFTTGLLDRDSVATRSMQGAAMAYDPATDRTYMIRGHLPFGGDTPNFISSQLQIAYTAGGNIWSNSGTWTVNGHINTTNSGKAKNFDAGFLTDPYGVLIGGASNYQPSFAVSNIGGGFNWTYRIYRISKADLITAPGSWGPGNNAIYELEPQNALGKRLNVAGNVDADNTNVDINQDTNVAGQAWKLVHRSDGYYELIPQNATGRRLNVTGGGTANGTNVDIVAANGSNAQQWRLQNSSGGFYELAPRVSGGKQLDVAGAGSTDGTNVQIYQRNGNTAQQWRFIKKSGARVASTDGLFSEAVNQLRVFPNPSSGEINILYTPQESGKHTLQLFDSQGRAVRPAIEGEAKASQVTEFTIEGKSLPTGTYIIRADTPTGVHQRKVLVVN